MPEPRIGFLQEMLRWWDQWLKGEPTGVSRDPDYRIYVMDAEKPGTSKAASARAAGSAISFWGFGNTETKKWYLNENGIGGAPGTEKALTISSPQTTGARRRRILHHLARPGISRRPAARRCSNRSPSIRPHSITDMDIVGQPAVELDFSVDKPVAFVAVRLNDVWPTGEVSAHHLSPAEPVHARQPRERRRRSSPASATA